MRVRIRVAAFVVVVLAMSCWWLVRAPAIEHQAVAPPPDIDIDPPAMRARRDAALALALMPDDPWTFAESLAASAPASAATPADKEQCGIDDRPQFAKPATENEEPVQTRTASARFVSAQARIDAALRASADPMDRAVADLVNAGEMRSDAGRYEAVVQQAVAASDPRLYALGYAMCRSYAASPSCGQISAERWAEVDAGNGIPWLYMLADARAAGDTIGVRNAMAHLASSSRFDVRLAAIGGAVAAHVPPDLADLAAANDLAGRTAGVAASMPFPSYQPLLQACRDHAGGDERLEQQCRTIGDTMFEHSDNLISLSISGTLQLQMTGDASRRDYVRAERTVLNAHWSPATGFSPCQDMRDSLKMQLRMAQVGEVEAMRERARKFVTP